MALALLVRHGRTTANSHGILAGRAAGVRLDEVGRDQAARMAERLTDVPLAALVTSPLERCTETSTAILEGRLDLEARHDPAVTECDYGSWQGRALAELTDEPLWSRIQRHPSSVTFPDGESLRAMQTRAVTAVRDHDERIAHLHGPHAVWAVVSHGDVIKSVLADALGMHLDLFQRLHVDPASISIVRYGQERPEVIAVNTTAGRLDWLARPGEATLGGGAGPDARVHPRS